ncbi:nitroreductase/quinone reductase family protein [Rhodococcus sp. NPDC059968]|uniref:nitroreductase/quinone reductase family protein n=1 Tax=Rhodococcus sp. NPDC059968 TaxID=3347017 RepID=UPI00366F3A9F
MERETGGRLNREWMIPSATLETTGAKSGLPQAVQITCFHDGRDRLELGGTKHPHRYYNLIAHTQCQLGRE